MRYIYILPLGNVNQSVFPKLERDLEKKFRFRVRTVEKIEIPAYTYNKTRAQYDGSKILAELARLEFPDAEKILAIASVDLFSQGLNFIFGQAEAPGKVCLISQVRLDPRFYGEKFDENLFYKRLLKEAVHELGHTFSLSHCPNKFCVMHFSNTLEDTDIKSFNFCEKCTKLLQMRIE